jgi:hypothetical protein
MVAQVKIGFMTSGLSVTAFGRIWGLTGVGFLQLGGVTSIKGIHRSAREGTPTLQMNGNIVE